MNINNFLKSLFSVITLLSIAIVTFFYWASSNNHSEDEYLQLIENNYAQRIDNDSVYSIITYNIGYLSGLTNNLPVAKSKALFEDNLTHAYQTFEALNADIICFQEIDYYAKRSYYVNQQAELQQLGYNNISQAVNWDVNYLPFPYFPPSAHHGEVYSGQSIFSKQPLFDNERIVLDRVENSPFYRDAFYLDRLAQVSKTTLGGETVVIINVHFEAWDVPTRTKQAQYISTLYKKYKDDYPVIILGDFNSDRIYTNAAVQLIIDLPGIKNAVNLDEKTYPSINPTVRIDYIFYNEKFIELRTAKILAEFGEVSDHLPIYMSFKLK